MRFYSRGKILLSGEYLVLFGAKALALPSRLGQHLEVIEWPGTSKIWINSRLNEQVWFSCLFQLPEWDVLETSSEMVTDFVKKIFQAASIMKPGYFRGDGGFKLMSDLEFDTRWGLGSSSSLISNLAHWLDLDPYELFWKVSPGSGYDIACARAKHPLFYSLEKEQAVVEKAHFNPPFKDKLFFVYMGHKQDSQHIVKDFRKRYTPDVSVSDRISSLSEKIASTNELEEFEGLIQDHEEILSGFLGVPTVKSSRFPGFKGTIKSLGAWGGDLVMVIWKDSEEELRKYFSARGMHLIFRYDDLI